MMSTGTSTQSSTARTAQVLLGVFVAAVLFRVVLFYSGLVDVVYMTNDSNQYMEEARSIVQSGTFSDSGGVSMNRTPGFPAFAALVFALFGESQLAFTAVQILIDALTCVMITHLALRLRLGRGAVLLASVMAATCVYTSVYTFEFMTETLYTFALTFAIWVWSGTSHTDEELTTTVGRAFLSGVGLGYAVLTRPALLVPAFLFGVAMVAVLVYRKYRAGGLARLRLPRSWLVPVVYGLGVLICIVPWMIRNRIVFADVYQRVENKDRVTPLGFKSPDPGADHIYATAFNRFWASYEQPYVQLSVLKAPVLARYVYPGEEAEVKAAFEKIEADVRATGTHRRESLGAFAKITEKRYQAAPRLYLTAPATLIAKLWITPRISVIKKNLSGHNSTAALVAGLTVYSSLYLVGLLGIWWGLRGRADMVALYLGAMALGHTFMYAFWLPMPQARYTVVLYPLLSLGTGAFLHHQVSRRTSRDAGHPASDIVDRQAPLTTVAASGAGENAGSLLSISSTPES